MIGRLYKLFSKVNFQKGFTLVELLVVISIIGILSALLLVSFTGAQKQARDTARKNDLKQYQTLLEQYASLSKSFYPSFTTSVTPSQELCDELKTVLGQDINCPNDPKLSFSKFIIKDVYAATPRPTASPVPTATPAAPSPTATPAAPPPTSTPHVTSPPTSSPAPTSPPSVYFYDYISDGSGGGSATATKFVLWTLLESKSDTMFFLCSGGRAGEAPDDATITPACTISGID